MATEYRPAYEAERIGARLVNEHHRDLLGVRIEYVFRDKAAKTAGKEKWGTARKISGLNAFLADFDRDEVAGVPEDFFVIELAEDVWDRIGEKSRVALVDHELCHCVKDFDDEGNVKLSLRLHDVEEFAQVISRHGLWRRDVEHFVELGAEKIVQGSLLVEGGGDADAA